MKHLAKKVSIALCALTTMTLMAVGAGCSRGNECEHDWGATATQVVKVATCMEKGEELWTCGKCGEEKTVKTEKKEHNLDDGVVVKEPTCSTTGSLLKKCMTTDCTFTMTEAIAKVDHTRVEMPEVKPTCTTAGNTAYAICEVCQTYLVPKTVLAALGHQNKVLAEVQATCTTAGLTEGAQCVLCNEVTKEQTVVAATGHNEVIDAYVAPTCGGGKTQGSHCSKCGEVLVAQTEIAGNNNHVNTATREEIPATCSSTGLTAVTYCTSCGETLSGGEEIAMTSHNMENSYCTVCDYHVHAWVVQNAVPATCTESGKTEGRYCSVCGEVKAEQITIPATNHINSATGEVETYQYGTTKAATCTASGSTAGQKCVKCDAVMVEATTIPAKGHKYVDGVCSVCGGEHNHTYTSTVTLAATCTTPGKKKYTCSCGKSYTEAYTATHNYVAGECTICGKKQDGAGAGTI